MNMYGTLSETINQLRREGYTEDFNLLENCLDPCGEQFEEFVNGYKVDNYFRFEGHSNPSDASILYAISSVRGNQKGLLVNAHGIYSNPVVDKMVGRLQMKQQDSFT